MKHDDLSGKPLNQRHHARDVGIRMAQAYLTLNRISASLTNIKRSCARALATADAIDKDETTSRLALRDAVGSAQLAIEEASVLAATLTELSEAFARSGIGGAPLGVNRGDSEERA